MPQLAEARSQHRILTQEVRIRALLEACLLLETIVQAVALFTPTPTHTPVPVHTVNVFDLYY